MKQQIHHYKFKAMAALCELQFFEPETNQATKVAEIAIHDISQIEQTFSRYRNDKLLYQMNLAASLYYADMCYQQ